MQAEILVALGRTCIRFDNSPKRLDHLSIAEIDLRRRALQRLADDLRGIEWNTKERLGDLGHFPLLVLGRAATGHRG